MDRHNIGLLGGCINKQKGIKKDDLYYNLLSEKLSGINFSHSVLLGTYNSYAQLHESAIQFIKTKKPHTLFLFIRPFPFMPLNKPLIKYDKTIDSKSYALHPALCHHNYLWPDKFTKHQSENEYEYVKKNKFGFRDLNLLAGLILGLHKWAMKYLTMQLNSIQQLCVDQNVRLIVILPPKNPESIVANFICHLTSGQLKNFCISNDIDFVNVSTLSYSNFLPDDIHLNTSGHKILAELIFRSITRNLKQNSSLYLQK